MKNHGPNNQPDKPKCVNPVGDPPVPRGSRSRDETTEAHLSAHGASAAQPSPPLLRHWSAGLDSRGPPIVGHPSAAEAEGRSMQL